MSAKDAEITVPFRTKTMRSENEEENIVVSLIFVTRDSPGVRWFSF